MSEHTVMAAFLKELGITCKFVFGEAIFFPKKGTCNVVHRNYIHNYGSKRPPFHCWLDVNGKVLDISVGSWTNDLHWRYRKEYIYGDYNNGFDIEYDFDKLYQSRNYNNNNKSKIIIVPESYSYRKFESMQVACRACRIAWMYRTNETMYEDLEIDPFYIDEIEDMVSDFKIVTEELKRC